MKRKYTDACVYCFNKETVCLHCKDKEPADLQDRKDIQIQEILMKCRGYTKQHGFSCFTVDGMDGHLSFGDLEDYLLGGDFDTLGSIDAIFELEDADDDFFNARAVSVCPCIDFEDF